MNPDAYAYPLRARREDEPVPDDIRPDVEAFLAEQRKRAALRNEAAVESYEIAGAEANAARRELDAIHRALLAYRGENTADGA